MYPTFEVWDSRVLWPVVLWGHIRYDEVIKWKYFLRYWAFVRGIHQSPVDSLHKRQWRRALIFFNRHQNKRLSKQSRRRWFETPLHSLWRHCNDDSLSTIIFNAQSVLLWYTFSTLVLSYPVEFHQLLLYFLCAIDLSSITCHWTSQTTLALLEYVLFMLLIFPQTKWYGDVNDNFRNMFLCGNISILKLEVLLNLISWVFIDEYSTVAWLVAWHRTDSKSLSKSLIIRR